MPDDSNAIDSHVLLQHMQQMEQRLMKAIADVKNDVATLDRKFDTLNTGVTEMDGRLDTLETNRIPLIEKHVGLSV